MSRAALPLLLLLGACASAEGDHAGDTDLLPSDTGEVDLPSFFLDVEPGVAEVDGRALLPQRFGPFLAGSSFRLTLHPAVDVRGRVHGQRLSPWLGRAAPLPTAHGDVAAALVFRGAADDAAWPARSGSDGRFGTALVPGVYTLAVTPDDPAFPAVNLVVQAQTDVDLDVDLGLGVPIWGLVRDDGGVPVPGALVFAERDDGLATSVSRTDASGWYQVRVETGTWRVVVAEPPGDRRPTLRAEPVAVGAEGARVDVSWATPDRASLGLRVSHGGAPVRDTLVRLRALRVSGYGFDRATYALETRTDSQGVMDVRLPAGTYAVEVIPGADARLGAVTLEGVVVAGDTDLGVVQLAGFTSTSLLVLDPGGRSLQGATAWCTELAGLGRSWSSQTDADGHAPLALPDSPLRCVVQPPGHRLDLAAARVEADAPSELEPVVLVPGQEVRGRVEIATAAGAEPGGFAIVRVVAADGTPIGTALADDDGRFTVRVDTRAFAPAE